MSSRREAGPEDWRVPDGLASVGSPVDFQIDHRPSRRPRGVRSRRVLRAKSAVEFEARPDAVTVAIPLEVWERIRGVPIDTSACWWDGDGDGAEGPAASPTIEEG